MKITRLVPEVLAVIFVIWQASNHRHLLFSSFYSYYEATNTGSNLPIVTTNTGQVQGHLIYPAGVPVYEFSGIPYATPPVGSLRFKKTKPIAPWSSVFDATKAPNKCSQTENKYGIPSPMAGSSEDCLVLTIWVPQQKLDAVLAGNLDDPIGVFAYIHDGSFSSGSIAERNASVLAGLNGIITSVIQYRLGSLGFAYSGTPDAPGNMGLWDQLEAMKWIYNNIASFGGDNNRITIAGESSGAASVSVHLLSPHSHPYFQRAIMQSASAIAPWASQSTSNALMITTMVFQSIADQACPTFASQPVLNMLPCLLAINGSLFPLFDTVPIMKGFGIPFAPVVDGDFIPEDPQKMLLSGKFSQVPLLIGANKDEGSMFISMSPLGSQIVPTLSNPNVPTHHLNVSDLNALIMHNMMVLAGFQPAQVSPVVLAAIAEIYRQPLTPVGESVIILAAESVGDYSFLCPTYRFAQHFAAIVPKVYVYHFTHRSSTDPNPIWMGVQHTDELPFVLGKVFLPDAHNKYSTDDQYVSEMMMKSWSNFVKTGNPNGNSTTERRYWPTFISDSCAGQYFEINLPLAQTSSIRNGSGVICRLRQNYCSFWNDTFPELIAQVLAAISEQGKTK